MGDGMTARYCTCGHSQGQHEIRSGGLLGCYISGCLCIDFVGQSPVCSKCEGAAVVEYRGKPMCAKHADEAQRGDR